MGVIRFIEKAFRNYLPSPFVIAVLLTLVTIVLALCFTENTADTPHLITILKHWEQGIWNTNLLVFGYQMMLILVLGHILVLSPPMRWLINKIITLAYDTQSAVILVSVTTMLMSFWNWGFGLIFGAILARKVGESFQQRNIAINYPLVGAAGYVGLMVWHGGMSGSAPLKVAETGHLTSLMEGISNPDTIAQLPQQINDVQTIFSWWNLLLFGILLIVVPGILALLARKTKPTTLPSFLTTLDASEEITDQDQGRLDRSRVLGISFGGLILIAFFARYFGKTLSPNMINFLLLGLGILFHGSFKNFLRAVEKAIGGASGILIQFPLYFGIMGIMKSTGMVTMMSDAFIAVANATTLPIFTFFSAGLVNIFVPSGGGQWAIQGPIVIESALQLGVPLPKAVMALAYGDQVTNMLQPFWALPLLGITKLKAKEILPYTLILMVAGSAVFILGLLLL